MGYLGWKYKVTKIFNGRYDTWYDIINNLSDKESVNFANEVIQKENLEFEEIKSLLELVERRVEDVCYETYKPIVCSIEVGDIEKIKETIDDKNIEFKNEEEKNEINSLLYSIFSLMSEENIRRAVKEDRECWDPNEMVYSMYYDWGWFGISCEEELDIILKNIEKIDFNKSEKSIINIITDIDRSSVIQKYFEKFKQYLSKEAIDRIEKFIESEKWHEHEDIVSGIRKVFNDVSLSVNEKMKELEKHINIMYSDDILRICRDCNDDIKIKILNKYPNKIDRIDTLCVISELKKESRYSINIERLNLYKRDIKEIYKLDDFSFDWYIRDEEKKEIIQSFKDMVISKSISVFTLLEEEELQEFIKYADGEESNTPVWEFSKFHIHDLFFTTKNQINRVNEEISNNNPKKARMLACMMGRVIDADVKQLLKDIDKKVAKEIYCDYYFNLYMLSEKDEIELREYFEIEDEQVLEEADEDYIIEKYYNLKNDFAFWENEKKQDNKRISISQIREIINKIHEDKIDNYVARVILTGFLENMNSDDIVETLKNDIEEEMARTIYAIMKRELIPPYKLSHDKRRELEEYLYRGEMVNEKWKNDENPKEGELEEGEDLNKDEKIISSEKLGCEHISEESQTEDDKKDVEKNREKKYDAEYSEEEKLNLLFDNQEKYTPEDIKNEITRLSGSYMVEGYRIFKNLFSEEEKQEIEEEILEFIEDNNNIIESEKIKEIILSLSNNGIEKGYERFGKYLDEKDREEVNKRIEEIKDDMKEKITEKNGILKGVKKFLANLLSKSKE